MTSYQILFKNKRITLKTNPRTGKCELCGRKKDGFNLRQTEMHHIVYHKKDPVKDTVEVCGKCHKYLHASETHFSEYYSLEKS